MKRLLMGSLAVAGAVVVATGCGKGQGVDASVAAASAAASGAASGAGNGGSGTISVTTVRAQKRDVDVMLEATGTVTALNSVDIRPQVSSVITRVNIREGQFVKAGDALFTLDARNDEVNLAKAQAQLAKDLAALADAQRQLARNRDLLAQNFISQGAVDTARRRSRASRPSSPLIAPPSTPPRSASATTASPRPRRAAPARSTSMPARPCSRVPARSSRSRSSTRSR